MSTDPNASGKTGDGGAGDPENTDVVAYGTYKKTVGEVKSLKAKLAELEAEKEQREQNTLKEQGKWKEAADAAETKAKDNEQKLLNQTKQFGQKVFLQEVRAVAQEMGALPEALGDIAKIGDWSTVDYDTETFAVDKEKLKAAMAVVQKEKPYLFGRKVSGPKDVTPGNGKPDPVGGDYKEKLAKMSPDQIIEWAKQNKDQIR